MKYIRDLEAAGFQRNQAEAQFRVVTRIGFLVVSTVSIAVAISRLG